MSIRKTEGGSRSHGSSSRGSDSKVSKKEDTRTESKRSEREPEQKASKQEPRAKVEVQFFRKRDKSDFTEAPGREPVKLKDTPKPLGTSNEMKSLTGSPVPAHELIRQQTRAASPSSAPASQAASTTAAPAYQAASTTTTLQAGGPGPSTQTKIDADAERIAAAHERSPAEGAKMIETVLKERQQDPDFAEYRKGLLKAAEPTIIALAKEAKAPQALPEQEKAIQDAIGGLARISEQGGPEVTQIVAKAFAQGLDDSYTTTQPRSPLAPGLEASVRNGDGTAFAVALGKELEATGKPFTADRVRRGLADGIRALTADFDAAARQVSDLTSQLQKAMYDAGPALTEAQQRQIVANFRNDPKYVDTFNKWEALGRTLTKTFDSYKASTGTPPPASADLVAQLADTKAGAEFIAREMAAPPSEKTLLATLGEQARDNKDIADKVGLALGKGAAWAALQGAEKGLNPNTVVKGLEKHAHLFGLSPQQMGEVTKLFGEFKPGMSTAEVQQLSQRINTQLGQADAGTPGVDPASPRGQVLRGIGVAFAMANLTGGFQDFSTASLTEKIKTVSDTLSVGADGAALVLETYSKAPRIASFLKAAGPAAAAVTALADGVLAVQAYKEGKYSKALEGGLMSAGGLLLAAGAIQGFPVGGQIIGAGLLLAGFGVKAYNSQQEARQIAELKTRLLNGVFPNNPAAAQALVNADRGTLLELRGLGLRAEQLQELGAGYPSLLEKHDNRGLEGLAKVSQEFNLSPEELAGFLQAAGLKDDKKLDDFLAQLDPNIGIGTTRPREEWIYIFEDLADSGVNPEQNRAAADYLRNRPDARD